jgi:hypothetical protein
MFVSVGDKTHLSIPSWTCFILKFKRKNDIKFSIFTLQRNIGSVQTQLLYLHRKCVHLILQASIHSEKNVVRLKVASATGTCPNSYQLGSYFPYDLCLFDEIFEAHRFLVMIVTIWYCSEEGKK